MAGLLEGNAAALEGIKHPARVALEVMRRTSRVLLVGDGAPRLIRRRQRIDELLDLVPEQGQNFQSVFSPRLQRGHCWGKSTLPRCSCRGAAHHGQKCIASETGPSHFEQRCLVPNCWPYIRRNCSRCTALQSLDFELFARPPVALPLRSTRDLMRRSAASMCPASLNRLRGSSDIARRTN